MSPQEPYDPNQAGQPGTPPPYPYGPPMSYPPPSPPTDDKAVWALVTAIGGFFLCPIFLHVIGWVLANQSLATIRASGGMVGGEGLAKAARILSIVGLVLFGVGFLLFILFVVVLGVTTSSSVGLGGV